MLRVPKVASSALGQEIKLALEDLEGAFEARPVLVGQSCEDVSKNAFKKATTVADRELGERVAAQATALKLLAEREEVEKASNVACLLTDGIGRGQVEAKILINEPVLQANRLAAVHYEANIARLSPALVDTNEFKKMFEFLKELPGAFKDAATKLGNNENGALARVLRHGLLDSQELSTARGALYEVETAYKIAQYEERVIYLGEKIEVRGIGKREFDITTSTRLIECKDIDWGLKVGEEANDLGSKICQQALIAEKSGKTFQVYSKRPLTEEWKQWFTSKKITVIEG